MSKMVPITMMIHSETVSHDDKNENAIYCDICDAEIRHGHIIYNGKSALFLCERCYSIIYSAVINDAKGFISVTDKFGRVISISTKDIKNDSYEFSSCDERGDDE